MNTIQSVCVYSASSTKIADCYFRAARELGELLAHHGIRLVNGAGNLGLMRACADACLEAGGQVTGVIPRFMVEQGWQHPGLTELIETEELLEIITWKQLGLYLNPIVVLNTEGFYNPLLKMLEHAAEEHFMRPAHLDIWKVASSPAEALDLLYSTPLWDKEVRKFAAI